MYADLLDSYIGGGQSEIAFCKPMFSSDFAVGQIREDRATQGSSSNARPILRVNPTLNLALLIEVFSEVFLSPFRQIT